MKFILLQNVCLIQNTVTLQFDENTKEIPNLTIKSNKEKIISILTEQNINEGAHGSWKLWILPTSLFTHFWEK